jgi:hypothetical protein
MNSPSNEARFANDARLLENIKKHLSELEELLTEMSGDKRYAWAVYRFYHSSWKAYEIPFYTRRIVDALRDLADGLKPYRVLSPDSAGEREICAQPFSKYFVEVLNDGIKDYKSIPEDNENFASHTRPLVEAFLHSFFFLQMAVKYGRAFDAPPIHGLPEGWAALLELFRIRY